MGVELADAAYRPCRVQLARTRHRPYIWRIPRRGTPPCLGTDDDMPGLTTHPPFPEDVPTYPLIIVDFELIQAGDNDEIEKLWKAAREIGFW